MKVGRKVSGSGKPTSSTTYQWEPPGGSERGPRGASPRRRFSGSSRSSRGRGRARRRRGRAGARARRRGRRPLDGCDGDRAHALSLMTSGRCPAVEHALELSALPKCPSVPVQSGVGSAAPTRRPCRPRPAPPAVVLVVLLRSALLSMPSGSSAGILGSSAGSRARALRLLGLLLAAVFLWCLALLGLLLTPLVPLGRALLALLGLLLAPLLLLGSRAPRALGLLLAPLLLPVDWSGLSHGRRLRWLGRLGRGLRRLRRLGRLGRLGRGRGGRAYSAAGAPRDRASSRAVRVGARGPVAVAAAPGAGRTGTGGPGTGRPGPAGASAGRHVGDGRCRRSRRGDSSYVGRLLGGWSLGLFGRRRWSGSRSRSLGDYLAGLRRPAKRRRKAVERAISGQHEGRQRDQRDYHTERDGPKRMCA